MFLCIGSRGWGRGGEAGEGNWGAGELEFHFHIFPKFLNISFFKTKKTLASKQVKGTYTRRVAVAG